MVDHSKRHRKKLLKALGSLSLNPLVQDVPHQQGSVEYATFSAGSARVLVHIIGFANPVTRNGGAS
ncbi:hypothetical protein EDC48_11678 [Gibbsiella quercinecans]|uniref:Uncharacterized protein n=1 Tax=Gibbsiella quercinecans TaxID=929813 RepID=A0A250B6R7_9GAMM|nr:hypothetical protein [Gibbsiella quercinecans]ATA21943.1 hypothetical protein AWC35_22855 [Gibbsiella quercinecans]RLM04762.1 hypothetical protein BIY31_18490 [Gibbsiella quercinecans]RLM08594.1 hypothetical protein BIY30_12610 [Gibbsiella quercinecans]TCT84822.1 hypothetical protein EDC48_11678 [Gibbsiella quercinecans]